MAQRPSGKPCPLRQSFALKQSQIVAASRLPHPRQTQQPVLRPGLRAPHDPIRHPQPSKMVNFGTREPVLVANTVPVLVVLTYIILRHKPGIVNFQSGIEPAPYILRHFFGALLGNALAQSASVLSTSVKPTCSLLELDNIVFPPCVDRSSPCEAAYRCI